MPQDGDHKQVDKDQVEGSSLPNEDTHVPQDEIEVQAQDVDAP